MKQYKKAWSTLNISLPAFIAPSAAHVAPCTGMFDHFNSLPFNRFPINKLDSLRDLIVFMILFISSFETINVVMPDPKKFLQTAASIDDALAVNPNGIKKVLISGLSTFLIIGKPVFSNSP